MSFTREELAAVGIGLVTLESYPPQQRFRIGTKEAMSLPDLIALDAAPLLRLALAHPERAELALGGGWSVRVTGTETTIVFDGPNGFGIEIIGRHLFIPPTYDPNFAVPLDFDAALARARRIAATWQRIQEQDGGK